MIVKCNLHQSAPRLTEYLISQAGNERIEIVANHGSLFTGLNAEDVRLTSKRMEIDFSKTAGKYPCYHVQISPGKDEHLTPEQIPQTIGTYLKERKLEGRPHIATVHHKPDGSMHLHLQISRYDPKAGKLDKNKMWRDDHDRIREKLETEFGHQPTPKKNPRRAEIKRQMTYLYSTSKTPQDFIAGVNKLGYVLAYGGNKSHPWQIVDSKAVGHNLTSLIVIGKGEDKHKITTKQMIGHMQGIRFPTLNEAIKMQRTKNEFYQLELKRAEEEAIRAQQHEMMAEQFNSPPAKPRVRVEVGKPAEAKKPDTSRSEEAVPPARKKEERGAADRPAARVEPVKTPKIEAKVPLAAEKRKEVVELDLSKKQDAWQQAIQQHKNQEAISKKQEGAIKAATQFQEKERAEKVATAFSEQKKDALTKPRSEQAVAPEPAQSEAERLAEERARRIREMEKEIEETLSRGRGHGHSM